MTCAKQVVRCTLVHPDGRRWVGENYCLSPQETCPRGAMPSGIGYHLCKEVCKQVGHAEVVAIAAAGEDAAGCAAYVEGHSYVCGRCAASLASAGVSHFEIGVPPVAAMGGELLSETKLFCELG